MNDCKEPSCVYSLRTKKCVKPNPYIQYLPQCKKLNLPLTTCKERYKLNIVDIKKNACNYYKDNNENKEGKKASCPKPRRPVNDNCPSGHPLLKNNKHNVKCCYKEPKVKKAPARKSSSTKFLSASSSSVKVPAKKSTPLNEFKMPSPSKYLNKKTGKYMKLVEKYRDRIKPKKI